LKRGNPILLYLPAGAVLEAKCLLNGASGAAAAMHHLHRDLFDVVRPASIRSFESSD
jgi:hypothetical protein